MAWNLSFNPSDLQQLCIKSCETKDGYKYAIEAINFTARSTGQFKKQIKNTWGKNDKGFYMAENIPFLLLEVIQETNTCSNGGHSVYIDPSGYYTLDWDDYNI